MKNWKAILVTKVLILLGAMFLTLALPAESNAQQPRISSISEIEGQVHDASRSLGTMAKYIIGAVMFIALIGVVYMVATSHPKSKEAVIGWVASIIVYIIAISII